MWKEEQEDVDEEEDTVLLSRSFSEKKVWAAGAGASGTSGSSGISKSTAGNKRTTPSDIISS